MEFTTAWLFGLLFGSFLNVVILRIPRDESVVFEGSHCYSCNTPLKPWHNIPLLSWIFLRGRCAFCNSAISWQYPLIELLSSFVFVLITIKMGISFAAFMVAMSFLMLLALSAIDLKYKMVPDSLNLLAILFAVAGAWSIDGVVLNFKNALLFAGGFTLLRFALSYFLTASARKEAKKVQTSWSKNYNTYPMIEAMGEGDIMVGATMGALLGIKLALVAVFLSACLALPVMLMLLKRPAEEQRVPFVPFLAMATLIVYLFDSAIFSYIKAFY